MAKPQVLCSADVVLDYSASSQLVALGADAAPGPITGWRWTILSVPPGSQAHVGSKGSFVDGVATVQAPNLLCDAGVDGGYTVQCVASNADGDSDPFTDKRDGQQAVVVRTQTHRLWLPGDYLFDWGEKYLNPTLRLLESLVGGGGGEPEPFWEWNGEDVSEFTIHDGNQVASFDVERVLMGGVPWIMIEASTGCGGSDWWDWAVILAAEGVVPPSPNYYLIADILFPGQDSARAIVGVRGDFSSFPSAMYGYVNAVNFEMPNGMGAEARLWALRGGANFDIARQTLEDSPYQNIYDNPAPGLGGRYHCGAEGDSVVNVLVHWGGKDDMLALDQGFIGGKFPASTAAGVPFIGVHGWIGTSPSVVISNIRAYEYRARPGAGSGDDTNWPGVE